MGQINFNNQKPKYCNLQAIQSGGSKANYPIPNGEVWMVDTTNSSKPDDGTGKYDSYVVGDGTTIASELVVYNIEDKEYDSTKFSGLGKKVLPKNIIEVSGTNKNVLTQAMVNTANTIYHIQYDYDLNGQTITLPTGCVLEFDGGSVSNGTLSGKLITKGGFDFANIGCVYNDSSYASHNTQCLAILSGLDDVEINLSNTIYFEGTNSSVFNGLSLHGHGNYVMLNSCSLFKSYGNLSFDNVKVVATGNASTFARLEDGIGFANVTFDGCYFEGNLRVFGCIRYATESFDRGIEKLLVNNCEFKEITCLNGGVSNIIFMISDTNYKSVVITNNIIHNFYSEFFGFAITNSSVYEGYISAFASKEQRDLLVSNNYVYNDLDYKPWESVSGYNAYFCFVLAEQGNCDYGDNVVKNIIGNNSNEAVYDAYFSVSNLIYHGNTIENCLNLTGAYNELLKGKGGYGNRIYTNNKFKTTDLSEVFDGTINTSVMLHFTQYNRKKMFVLQDNVFEIYQLNINYSYTYDYEKLQILGNIIKVQEALANNNLASFFNPSIDSSEINVENNIIDVQSITLSGGTSGICVAGLRTAGIKVNISNNTLRNVCLLGANANSSYNYVGTANNNHLTYDEQNFNIRNILANYSSGLQYHNNYVEIIAGGFTNTDLFTYINRPVEADCRIAIKKEFSGSNPLGCFYKILSDSDVTYNIVAKYHERNSDFKLISEENYIFADSQGSYYGYEINGNIQSWNSGSVSLFSFSDATTYLRYIQARGSELRSFVYSGDVIDYELKITKAKSSDVLNYHPTQGVSAKRPTLSLTDKGAKYFDTSIGYSISWDGNKWVDADGFTAALKKGTTAQRPTILTNTDNGFVYYDETLNKIIQYYNGVWLDLLGEPFYAYSRVLTLDVGKEITSWQSVGASISLSENSRPVVNCISILIPSGTAIRVIGCAGVYGSALVLAEKEADENNKHKILEKYGNAQASSFVATDDAQVYMAVSKEECYLIVNVVNDTNSPKYGNNAETPYSVTIYSNTPFE